MGLLAKERDEDPDADDESDCPKDGDEDDPPVAVAPADTFITNATPRASALSVLLAASTILCANTVGDLATVACTIIVVLAAYIAVDALTVLATLGLRALTHTTTRLAHMCGLTSSPDTAIRIAIPMMHTTIR